MRWVNGLEVCPACGLCPQFLSRGCIWCPQQDRGSQTLSVPPEISPPTIQCNSDALNWLLTSLSWSWLILDQDYSSNPILGRTKAIYYILVSPQLSIYLFFYFIRSIYPTSDNFFCSFNLFLILLLLTMHYFTSHVVLFCNVNSGTVRIN